MRRLRHCRRCQETGAPPCAELDARDSVAVGLRKHHAFCEHSSVGEKMDALKFCVDAEKCIGCDACVRDCPSEIIRRQATTPEAAAPTEGACLECQHCLAVCPSGAISAFGLEPKNSLPLRDGCLPTYRQMKTLVRGRRSVRQFLAEDVPPPLVNELLTDLAHAPTGCNARDLVFSVVPGRASMSMLLERLVQAIEARQKSGAAIDDIADAAAAYRNAGRDFFFRGAPHLLVVSPGGKAMCGHEDAVIALAYFELLAQSAGLGTTWCGMLKFVADAVPQARELLGLAPDAYFYAMMFGKPAVSYARTAPRIRWIRGA